MARFQPKSRDGKDWFRQTRWGSAEQALFRKKLARARKASRPQCLRLQAHTLESRDPRAAMGLYDELIAAYPDNGELASVHNGRARLLLSKGEVTLALSAYEDAMAAMDRYPNYVVQAAIDYPLLIARSRLADRYDRALAILDAEHLRPAFPIDHFRVAAARAMIAEARGQRAEAGPSHASLWPPAARRTRASATIPTSDWWGWSISV